MASSHLELARSIFAAWEHGDFSSTEWAHREIEFSQPDLPGSENRIGIVAMAEAWREFLSEWEEFRVASDGFRELDDERVLAFGIFGGRGRRSGVDVGSGHMQGILVFHFRDDEVTKIVAYYNRERGLADLGLDPEGNPADTPGPRNGSG